MDFFRFLFSRKFIKHLGAALVILGILIWIIFLTLGSYTKHGEYISVPNFAGKDVNLVIGNLDYKDFGFVVIDSVFDLKLPKGIIVRQDPLPDSKVKSNRKIYLTIVSTNPENTLMPDLKFLTLRQAISLLESTGLKVGRISYIPSFDQDAVQQQHFQHKVVDPGTKLVKGSTIDLTVGMGSQGQAPEEIQKDTTQNDSI